MDQTAFKNEASQGQRKSLLFALKLAEWEVLKTKNGFTPILLLDDVFEKKEEIALAIQRDLKEAMLDYGYDIIKALVTDIDPDDLLKLFEAEPVFWTPPVRAAR